MYQRSLIISVCFSLLLFLAACDSGGSDDPGGGNGGGVGDAGNVELSITGDGVDETFEGQAYFVSGSDYQDGEQAFAIYIYSGEEYGQSSSFAFIGRNTDRPGTGRYPFANADDDSELKDGKFLLSMTTGSSGGEQVTVYSSTGGTLDLSTSSDDYIAGSIDVQATAFSFGGGNGQSTQITVNISGDFEAPGRDNFAGTPFKR